MDEKFIERTRRRPGPSRSFSQEEIIRVAVRILDRNGSRGLSIRNLATELGTAPMTLYIYFPTKGALWEAVVDLLIEPLRPPRPAAPDWAREVREYAQAVWKTLSPHPWLASVLVEGRLLERPRQAEARRALLDLFGCAGADQATARACVAAFYSFMIGSFLQARPPTPGSPLSQHANELFERGLAVLLAGIADQIRAHSRPMSQAQ